MSIMKNGEKSVLVVDDHLENQLVLKRILDSMNISYDSASDGDEALTFIEKKEYAVVLMDIQMPGKNGFEVKEIMDKETSYYDSPVIFITGEEREESSRIKGYNCGASDYLLKPVNPNAISQKVKTFCELFEFKRKKRKSLELERNALLGKISHEIRTPMNGILGNLQELMKSSNLNPEEKELIKGIEESSGSLLNVVDKLIGFSMLKQGKVSLDPKVIHVQQEIGSVLNDLEGKANESGNHLSLEVAHEVPEYIKIDGEKVCDILYNIVENSLKFSENGIVKLRVSNQEGLSSNRLFFEVRDSGIGIEKELQNSLFEGFTQVDNTNTSTSTGAGLGLSISKELIDILKGDIYFTSEHGVGTTFYFSVLYDKVKKEEIPRNAGGTNADLKFNLKALIVEDQLVNQKVASMMLEGYGCEIDTASNGVEALQKMDKDQYDLVLMDIEMPIMNGFETIKRIRENYSNQPQIYAITANCMRSDQDQYKKAGFDAFMLKPLSKNDLIGYMFKDFSHLIAKE